MRKIITLLLMVMMCCPIASAGFVDLQISPSSQTVELYPGQQVNFEYEYTFLEDEFGANQIPSDVYSKKTVLVEQEPNIQGTSSSYIRLYEEEFTMGLGETVNKKVPYTETHDIGEEYYLAIYIQSYVNNYEPYGSTWFNSYNDICRIKVNVIEEPDEGTVIDDDIDIGDIGGDNSLSLEDTNLLLGLIVALSLAIGFYSGILQRTAQLALSNPLLAVFGLAFFIIMVML